MSYENAKKVTLLGFGLKLLISIFSIFNSLIFGRLGPDKLVKVISAINIVNLAAFVIVAVGFLLMWISDRNMIDLLACGAAVLPIIFYFVFSIFVPNISSGVLFSMINSLVYSAIYIALALKVKDSNAMIALLLICMFGYNVFFSRIISNLLANANVVRTLTSLISYAANIAGAALCFLAVRAEE